MSETKKQLLKLSKPQLIKKCKTSKVSTVGNKSDMIDRILMKINNKKIRKKKKIPQKIQKKRDMSLDPFDDDDNAAEFGGYNDYYNNHIQPSSSIGDLLVPDSPDFPKEKNVLVPQRQLSMMQKTLLVHGFTDNLLASSLILLIIKYISYLFVFDLYPDKCKDDIKNNGTLIQRGRHNDRIWEKKPYTKGWWKPIRYQCTYTSSQGFNHGIIEWKIQIKYNLNRSYTFDWFGIIASVDQCKGYDHLIDNIKVSYLFMKDAKNIGGGIRSGDHGKRDDLNDEAFEWKENDILSFCLDCIKWTFCAKKNDIQIDKIDIVKDSTYYPVIESSTDNSKYSLLYK